jgi:outer membrane receptor protein involved in Fe transport
MSKLIMRYLVFTVAVFFSICGYAQFPGGGQGRQGGGNRQNMNIGHMFGKVVDSKTNKGIDAATVQFIGNKFDTATKKMKQVIFATLLTESRGDFSVENLPLFGNLTLRISIIGYADYTQQVSFGVKFGGQGANAASSGQSQQERMQQMLSMADKDLGNIKITAAEGNLAAVTVTSTKPFFEMGIDKKIFNVDKNLVSTGQTATEVMKQIPSLNVDIDGNVTMRNATPQLFIDGRPTTLTLDQIPADLIDKVELISNPSAKYDASGGGAGILNIVLKKNIKRGYNGGIRAGVDSRGKINSGADLNFRQGKLNFFLNGMYNQRLTKYTSTTAKNDLKYDAAQGAYLPRDSVFTNDIGQNKGGFGFLRGGMDYFMDNRNTISFALNYNKGQFDGSDNQAIDSTVSSQFFSSSSRITGSQAHFQNLGSQVSFKHNFMKNGHNLTADFNFNSSKNSNLSGYTTNTYADLGNTNPKYLPFLQNTEGSGTNKFYTLQSDYENPITDNKKIEAGVRAAIRDITSMSNQYIDSVFNPTISSNYKFNDQVYAAYGNYAVKGKKFNYQVGLRAESSSYTGTNLLGKDTVFKVNYPISLFPSAFVTYKVTDRSDLQVNYTRRVNRPNFFQLLPSVDLTDPQNPRKGNPGLTPEFTNSFELSYDKSYVNNSNFLATAFVRYTTDLITTFYYRDLSPSAPVNGPYTANDTVQYVTYKNANSSISYGLELTNRTTIAKMWDMTVNVNLFDSKINGTNLQNGLNNERVSWFAKFNNNFKLPKKYSIQLSGNYQSKTILPQNGGGGGRMGGGGGGFFGGGGAGTAQGYIYPFYSVDIAIRKDWQWKGGRSGSITLSMNDIFRTALNKTYSSTELGTYAFNQLSERRRDPQVVRLNFSYRFGKIDADLFKRKNTKADNGGGADIQGQ